MPSVLLRRIVRGTSAGPWLVALHADGADAGALVPLCRAAAPALPLCALQAPRSRNPFLGSGHAPDAPGWRAYRGYSWFRHGDGGRPEPASFAEALRQVAAATAEVAADGRPVLVGDGDGATLALAAAAEAPGRLAGVVALGGDGAEAPAGVPVLRLPRDGETACLARAVARWLADLEVCRGRC